MFLLPFKSEYYRLRARALTFVLLVVGIGLLIGSLIHRDIVTAVFSIVIAALGILGLFQYRRDKSL